MDQSQDRRTVLFDFDGTLADTRPAIVTTYRAAIKAILDIDILPDDDHLQDMLRRRPLEYFTQHYGAHAPVLENAYRARYIPAGISLYPGISNLLDTLDAMQTRYGIVTNKGRDRVLADLEQLGVSAQRFAILLAAEDCPLRKPDPAPINMALAQLQIAPVSVTYVGDGPHDMKAANAAGVRAVGVSWGYYSASSLKAENPHSVCHDHDTLLESLLS